MAASGQDALPVCSTGTPRQVLEMSKRRRYHIPWVLVFGGNRRVSHNLLKMFSF